MVNSDWSSAVPFCSAHPFSHEIIQNMHILLQVSLQFEPAEKNSLVKSEVSLTSHLMPIVGKPISIAICSRSCPARGWVPSSAAKTMICTCTTIAAQELCNTGTSSCTGHLLDCLGSTEPMLLQSFYCCSSLKGGTHMQRSEKACVITRGPAARFCQSATGTLIRTRDHCIHRAL